jgi:hypothetical protein
LFLSAKSRQVKGCFDFSSFFNRCLPLKEWVNWVAAIQRCRPALKKVGLPLAG